MQIQHLGRTSIESEVAFRKQVDAAWNDFVTKGVCKPGSVRDVIHTSWQRCKNRGVEHTQHYPPMVASGAQLKALFEENDELLMASKNTWKMLADILSDTQSLFTVAEANGVLLDVCGNTSLRDSLVSQRIAPGYDWSEGRSGTNAVGTVVALKQAVSVHGVEHFCETVKIWSCAAAPIIDRIDGDLLGVIDVTTVNHAYSEQSMALAMTAARQIEQTLQSRELTRNVKLLDWFAGVVGRWYQDGVILLDRKGRVVTANEKAKTLFARENIQHQLEKSYRLLQAERLGTMKEWEALLPPAIVPVAYESYNRDGHAEGGILVVRPVQASAHKVLVVPRILSSTAFDGIVGQSAVLQSLKARAARLALSSAPVLIQGETGTGKELFARAIHCAGRGGDLPFVAVNCGALTSELAVTELLGYEAGAFRGAKAEGCLGKFEEADGGTLFLDEITELPLTVQAALLRVIQDNVVVRLGSNQERVLDVRIIATTNGDLDGEVERGSFRKDLFYRLKVMVLDIIALRERTDDIDSLAQLFLQEFSRDYGFPVKQIAPSVLEALAKYSWPGNVRELQSVLESMFVMSDTYVLTCSDLPVNILCERPVSPALEKVGVAATYGDITLNELEREAINKELLLSEGNRSRVARQLGISRSTLYRKIKAYGLVGG